MLVTLALKQTLQTDNRIRYQSEHVQVRIVNANNTITSLVTMVTYHSVTMVTMR